MSAIIVAIVTTVVCTYLAGALAAFGAANARATGEEPNVRQMLFVASFSWLSFGYLVCGGKITPETPPSTSETFKLSGSTGSNPAPW
jgi:hypothetical protein